MTAWEGKERRWFWGLVTLVVLLAVMAVVVALHRMGDVRYRTDDTPTAAVYNYLLAIKRGDFDRAYALLGNVPCKPGKAWFVTVMSGNGYSPEVDIVSETQTGDRAIVTLEIYDDGGLFGVLENGRWESRVALRREGGQWKIVRFPNPLWPFPPLDMPAAQCPRGGD